MFPKTAYLWFFLFAFGTFAININSDEALPKPNTQEHKEIFDESLKSQVAKLNTSYKLKCVVKMDTLKFWTVDGHIPDGFKFKILPDSNLVIKNITLDDFNREYLCHAVIPGKERLESIQISLTQHQNSRELKAIASPFLQISTVFALVASEKTLTCTTRARPFPRLKWFYGNNGTIISNKTDFIITTNNEDVSNLTIFIRNVDYFGEYVCEAFGTNRQVFSLRVPEKPNDVPFVFPKLIGTTKVIFALDYDKSQNFTVYLQYKEANDEEWMGVSDNRENPEYSELQNLKANTTYLVRAAVKNEFVLGDYSEAIKITTDKDPSIRLDGWKHNHSAGARNLKIDDFPLHKYHPDGFISSIQTNAWTLKKISKIGGKLFITTNMSTIEEIS